MGSTGTGRFSDYPKAKRKGNSGGASGEDKCALAIKTALEDVERCDFYSKASNLPENDSKVHLRVNSRIEVLSEDDVVIGYLPTKYNYIASCMEDGWSYEGIVVSSSDALIPTVNIALAPE